MAVIITEMWPEWGLVGIKDTSAEYLKRREVDVIARAKQMPEAIWQERSCSTGWCAKCEDWNDEY